MAITVVSAAAARKKAVVAMPGRPMENGSAPTDDRKNTWNENFQVLETLLAVESRQELASDVARTHGQTPSFEDSIDMHRCSHLNNLLAFEDSIDIAVHT
jgi:hypothetical protein